MKIEDVAYNVRNAFVDIWIGFDAKELNEKEIIESDSPSSILTSLIESALAEVDNDFFKETIRAIKWLDNSDKKQEFIDYIWERTQIAVSDAYEDEMKKLIFAALFEYGQREAEKLS